MLPETEDKLLTYLKFTPARLSILAMAAVAITFGTIDQPSPAPSAINTDPSGLFHSTQAIGQDNGSLTSNLYLATFETPSPLTHIPITNPDRHGVVLAPTPQTPPPTIRHNYPPLAR